MEYCKIHPDIELRNRKDKKGKYCRICTGKATYNSQKLQVWNKQKQK